MRPYGSRKCHCNGKASRGRERRFASFAIAEQVSESIANHEIDECDGDCRNCDVTWDWYEDWMMMQLAASDALFEIAVDTSYICPYCGTEDPLVDENDPNEWQCCIRARMIPSEVA